jgi:N6-L-threonylcarbamoyladenine synthase
MKILSIETSCDETALALVETVISNESITAHTIKSVIFSQIDIHKEYGGVFPIVAKREHARSLPILLKELLENQTRQELQDDDTTWSDIQKILLREEGLFEDFQKIIPTLAKPDVDMIAVTQGPGLEPALWVGISFARALSLYWGIPMLGVNHMKGHIFSVLLNQNNIEFPALSLLISGGHTEIVHMDSLLDFTIIGQTQDDAIGESYDKVARMLGLEYPGGPKIAELAQQARQSGLGSGEIILPRPMIHSPNLHFSFSGLKTAVLYKLKEYEYITDELKLHIAHEFEESVTDVLLKKIEKVLINSNKKYKNIIVSGGVIANTYIRSRLQILADKYNIPLLLPIISDSTDNAQMIAVAGAIKSLEETPQINQEIKAIGSIGY